MKKQVGSAETATMGLEDFKSEDEYSIGSISTRKKVKNVKLDKRHWEHLLWHDPHWASFFGHKMDEQSIKAVVQLMDEIIEEGVEGVARNEEKEQEIEEERDKVVEEFLKE